MLFYRIIHFFLFGSIFISLCAVGLCIQTSLLLNLPLHQPGFYLFVFGATLVQYNLHYLFNTTSGTTHLRLDWCRKNKGIPKILIGAGVLMIAFGIFSFTTREYIILTGLGIVSFCYSFPLFPFTHNKINNHGILKILTLALVWTMATVWLPADKINFNDGSFQHVFVQRLIFIFILCLLQIY